MSDVQTVMRSHDTKPMTVANMTFMVNKLAKECAPLQFVRELTQNAIEAIKDTPSGQGEIQWDVDWNRFDLGGQRKLCVIDTGTGMTGEEMVNYINKLSSSIHHQSDAGNFGVGAKISAVPLNPRGLIYLSWKEGQGSMIHLWFDEATQEYGLRRFANGEFWAHLNDDDLKPEPISEHGTMVILCGHDDEEDTISAPPGAPMPSRWILRYLNTRYFRFPAGITVKAREGWDLPRSNTKHNFLREIHGQGPWLDSISESSGLIDLEDAKVHWWIVKEDVDTDSGHNAGAGHVAALFQDELYEMKRGNAGYARLQAFGVIFGTDRVVIYVEPKTLGDNGESLVSANTARTQLLRNGETLPWIDWATQFRELMPEQLIKLQHEIAGHADAANYKKAISERLKAIMDLLRFTRFRPSKKGELEIADDDAEVGGVSENSGKTKSGSSKSGGTGGRGGDIYSLFTDQEGQTGEEVPGGMNEPDVIWLSEEEGTLPAGDLADRAARYLAGQNQIVVNGDFRVFTDMIDRWVARYSDLPNSRTVVKAVVREWFEQQLKEAVMSALSLKSTGKWSMEELKELLDEKSLTACVLPRYHIDVVIKRVLGQKLGSLRAASLKSADAG